MWVLDPDVLLQTSGKQSTNQEQQQQQQRALDHEQEAIKERMDAMVHTMQQRKVPCV
jgi:hypothetical protein